MKFGIRTPNIKKSLKARTTGRAKRAVKKAIIPGYGKKGTGIIKNPKKAVYNKIYNKTTVSAFPKIYTRHSKTQKTYSQNAQQKVVSKNRNTTLILCITLGYFGVHNFYVGKSGMGILYLFTIGLFGFGWVIDIILIATGKFKDNYGLNLK